MTGWSVHGLLSSSGEARTQLHVLAAAGCSSHGSGVSHISQLGAVPLVLKPDETPFSK